MHGCFVDLAGTLRTSSSSTPNFGSTPLPRPQITYFCVPPSPPLTNLPSSSNLPRPHIPTRIPTTDHMFVFSVLNSLALAALSLAVSPSYLAHLRRRSPLCIRQTHIQELLPALISLPLPLLPNAARKQDNPQLPSGAPSPSATLLSALSAPLSWISHLECSQRIPEAHNFATHFCHNPHDRLRERVAVFKSPRGRMVLE
ncbi:hypothetical protein B0H16DRAFT_1742053 [Mycena metata]|uniref:Uncharacterized protein n=1 Tax=Mycena metata TaxID=1033252 RepID=A0AAD7MFW0_9AGAR|nr:hypothetical protein B0H16DRAFT_1742053 [Mycena metata]